MTAGGSGGSVRTARGLGALRSFSDPYADTRIATTSQSPEGTASKAKIPAGSVRWRHGCGASRGSSAVCRDTATPATRSGPARAWGAADALGGAALIGRRGSRTGGSATRLSVPRAGFCASIRPWWAASAAWTRRDRRFVLGAGRPRALPDSLQLRHEGGGGRVEGDLDRVEWGQGPGRGLLLDREPAPDSPGRTEAAEGLGDLGARVLADSAGHPRRDGAAQHQERRRAERKAGAPAAPDHAGRLFQRRCTQNHCSGWARTCRSIAAVKRAVFTTIS